MKFVFLYRVQNHIGIATSDTLRVGAAAVRRAIKATNVHNSQTWNAYTRHYELPEWDAMQARHLCLTDLLEQPFKQKRTWHVLYRVGDQVHERLETSNADAAKEAAKQAIDAALAPPVLNGALLKRVALASITLLRDDAYRRLFDGAAADAKLAFLSQNQAGRAAARRTPEEQARVEAARIETMERLHAEYEALDTEMGTLDERMVEMDSDETEAGKTERDRLEARRDEIFGRQDVIAKALKVERPAIEGDEDEEDDEDGEEEEEAKEEEADQAPPITAEELVALRQKEKRPDPGEQMRRSTDIISARHTPNLPPEPVIPESAFAEMRARRAAKAPT